MLTKGEFLAAPAVLALLAVVSLPVVGADDRDDVTKFNMVVSAGAKTCLPSASGTVRITPAGSVEIMDVIARR